MGVFLEVHTPVVWSLANEARDLMHIYPWNPSLLTSQVFVIPCHGSKVDVSKFSTNNFRTAHICILYTCIIYILIYYILM